MRNKRIFKNTVFLYARQIIVILINLYAVRIVLNTLGINDYGIFTVVVGFVTLLAFLPGTMASATQRFFSYALGENDQAKLNKTFSVNWILYGLIACVIVVALESLGYWYIKNHITIPTDRVNAALQLYHYIVFSFALTVFSAPFMAILIAHEDVHLYAIISIIEAALKLSAAIALNFLPWDNLSLYGMLLLGVSFINALLFILCCVAKYIECQFSKIYWDVKLVKEILGFTSWTMFGQITTVFRNQAITVLLNQFFNPATVAARAIAVTVSSQVTIFALNFNLGLYPSIVKTYATNQKEEMYGLVNNGSKLTFFLMWVFALPLILEMQPLLELWLKEPPPSAVIFTQLGVVEALILSISLPITTAARAPGKMMLYELVLGSIQLLIFLASWFILEAGYPATSVFIIAIIANIIMFKVRLLLVHRLAGLPIIPFYKDVVIPISWIIFISCVPSIAIANLLPSGLVYTFLTILLCMIFSTVSMYFIGLNKEWRTKVKGVLIKRLFGLRGQR